MHEVPVGGGVPHGVCVGGYGRRRTKPRASRGLQRAAGQACPAALGARTPHPPLHFEQVWVQYQIFDRYSCAVCLLHHDICGPPQFRILCQAGLPPGYPRDVPRWLADWLELVSATRTHSTTHKIVAVFAVNKFGCSRSGCRMVQIWPLAHP